MFWNIGGPSLSPPFPCRSLSSPSPFLSFFHSFPLYSLLCISLSLSLVYRPVFCSWGPPFCQTSYGLLIISMQYGGLRHTLFELLHRVSYRAPLEKIYIHLYSPCNKNTWLLWQSIVWGSLAQTQTPTGPLAKFRMGSYPRNPPCGYAYETERDWLGWSVAGRRRRRRRQAVVSCDQIVAASAGHSGVCAGV